MPPKKKLCAPSWQPKLFMNTSRTVIKTDTVSPESDAVPSTSKDTAMSVSCNSVVSETLDIDPPSNIDICTSSNSTASVTSAHHAVQSATSTSSSTSKPRKVDKYQPKWAQLHPWLQYDSKANKMFCKVCVKHGKSNTMTEGCSSFKTSSLTRHEELADHKAAVESPVEATHFKKAVDNVLSDEDQAIAIAAKVVYWMASEDIALSKFESLMGLLNDLKVEKINLLKISERVNYSSYYSANELLKAIDAEIDSKVQGK